MTPPHYRPCGALAEHPDLVDRLGDLAGHVERGLVALAAGPSLAGGEAVAAHLAKIREELGEAAAPPLEKLLVRRLVLGWLACHQAEVERVGLLQGRGADVLRVAAERRVDRAHARLLASAKALATVRRLVRPGLSTVELAMTVVRESRPWVTNRVRGELTDSAGEEGPTRGGPRVFGPEVPGLQPDRPPILARRHARGAVIDCGG